MSLTPPAKVRKLRDALHSKAKDAPGYRFYALYDKLYRDDVLRFAYDRCKANGGAPGVDRQDFADIEAQGLETWLSALTGELRKATYRPQPVRRVNIPKDGQPGKSRPLGIPICRSYCTSFQRGWGLSDGGPAPPSARFSFLRPIAATTSDASSCAGRRCSPASAGSTRGRETPLESHPGYPTGTNPRSWRQSP